MASTERGSLEIATWHAVLKRRHNSSGYSAEVYRYICVGGKTYHRGITQ
jgi:hypothetical protein